MKKLILLGLLLAGCSRAPTACYDLEMCEVEIHGHAEHWYSSSLTFNVYCIYGYDKNGKKNGDVKRFMSRDALSAWSILHQDAKPCKE